MLHRLERVYLYVVLVTVTLRSFFRRCGQERGSVRPAATDFYHDLLDFTLIYRAVQSININILHLLYSIYSQGTTKNKVPRESSLSSYIVYQSVNQNV